MTKSNDPHRRYAEAARDLFGSPDARPGRDAFRVVCGSQIREEAQTAAVLAMALETTGGLLYLEMPEHGVWLGPQRLVAIRRTAPGSGHRFDLTPNCAFWAADDHAELLVASRDGARHFELGTEGLRVRDGAPAGDLEEGFGRAAARLRAAAGAPDPDHQPRELAEMIGDDDLDPAYRLELLASSDPKARASMMRHTVALRSMMTGRLHDREVPRVLFGANFGTTLTGVEDMKALTRADGHDRIMIGFDVDDPSGPPANFGLWHIRDGVATFYDRCAPWIPTAGTRAFLIGQNDQEVMTFRYQPGRTLLRTAGTPAKDPWPGIRRAAARLARLVETTAVRNAVGDVHIRIAPSGGGDMMLTLPTGPLSDG